MDQTIHSLTRIPNYQAKSSSRKQSVLWFSWRSIDHDWSGGEEQFVHQVCSRLARKFDVTVFSCNSQRRSGTEHKKSYNQLEVGSHDHYPIHAWLYALRFAHYYDVVIEDASKIPLFLPFRQKVIVVHHLNRRIYFKELDRVRSYIAYLLETSMPRLYSLFSSIKYITVSNYSKAELAKMGVPKDLITVVREASETDILNTDDVGKSPYPSMCVVARLVKYKRVEHILFALVDVVKLFPSAKLFVVGDGVQRPSLENLSKKLGLQENISFLGRAENDKKIEVLKMSWLNLVTSEKEGWCLVVNEAARFATPTVAYRNSGLQESVIDGKTGILVSDGDIRAFSEEVINLLHDPQKILTLGRNAEENMKHSTWDSTAKEIEKVIEL